MYANTLILRLIQLKNTQMKQTELKFVSEEVRRNNFKTQPIEKELRQK